ncbi:MAG: hypothetical protein E6K59_02580 [Nitrospirae bacterium]|nr:MAG: hypothetical protein E6K59_02580 [Nitrospirota bacterium]
MRTFMAGALIILFVVPIRAHAIELQPSAEQIASALEQGKAATTTRTPPVELYSWFGPPSDPANEFRPRGFLMTKLSGLAVLSAHFALRAQQPNEQEIRRILDDQYLQVSITLYGDRRDFAQNTFVMLVQGGRKIMPVRIRADDTADRTSAWPKSPAYRAKVVASFTYGDFDPLATTQLFVFPRTGGEISFDLDFAAIP